ncbi:hypothetical protein CC79DRAFT_1363960 [Sarocladium strictum]
MGGCFSKKDKKAAAAVDANPQQADSQAVNKPYLAGPESDNPGTAGAPQDTRTCGEPPAHQSASEQQPVALASGEPAIRDFAERPSSLEITPAPPLGSRTY